MYVSFSHQALARPTLASTHSSACMELNASHDMHFAPLHKQTVCVRTLGKGHAMIGGCVVVCATHHFRNVRCRFVLPEKSEATLL